MTEMYQKQVGESSNLLPYIECRLNSYDSCLRDEHAAFAASPTPEHALAADGVLDLALSKSASVRGRVLQELLEILRREQGDDFGRSAEQVKLRTNGELQLAEGHPAEALRIMEIAAVKDEPVGDREYLVRALLAVAETKHNKVEARLLLLRAQAAYAAVALQPALERCDMDRLPPGSYGDQLEAYLKVSQSLGDRSEVVQLAERELLALRPGRPAETIH